MSQWIWRGHVRLATFVVCLGVFFGIAFTNQTAESAAVLISHWQLDEGTGTTTIDSVASRTGTLLNGVAWTTGGSGTAVEVDGVNDYIALPSMTVSGSAITLAAWVKNSSFQTGVRQRFISKANDSSEQGSYWVLGQANSDGQNVLRFRLRAGGVTTSLVASTGILPLDTWYHAAATYDGITMRLYLNGAQVASVAKSGRLSWGSSVPINIGRSPDGSNYMRGAIDDVRIYSSALNATEIGALAAAGSSSNQPPTVSLSSPENGATYPAGTTIPVSATAADADGTVGRVEFYADSTLIGTVTSSPYSVSWPNVAAGVYTLKAVAWDAAGASATADTRSVTVSSFTSPNQPPTVSLTAPASGATFTAPGSIILSATASDVDGTIARLDFYAGTTLIGTVTSSPYSLSWSDVAAGSYSLTAVASDDGGATTVSSTRDIAVQPANLPTTAVFTPSNNHATDVDRYVLEIFPLGADTAVANPVSTHDLGKPAIIDGECSVDVSSTILALAPGTYIATVTADGSAGSTQSAPSPQFVR